MVKNGHQYQSITFAPHRFDERSTVVDGTDKPRAARPDRVTFVRAGPG